MKPVFQFRDLIRKDQTKMSAFDHTVLNLRYITKNRNTQFFFQKFLHSRIEHGRHLVKDHTFDVAVLLIFQETFDIGSQGHTHPTAVYNQNHRCIRSFCKIIGTGSGCRSTHTIIITHDTFHHRNLTVCGIFCQKVSGPVFICKKCIQIPGFRTDYPAVEHRINIIRSTFKRGSL